MCGYFCIGFIDFMLAKKTLTEFTNLFSPNNFKLFYQQCLKMDKCNSIEHDFHKTPNMYLNLNANISNEQQLRLNKTNEITDYSLAEIRERELISKNLSKYTTSFEYFNKSLFFYLH